MGGGREDVFTSSVVMIEGAREYVHSQCSDDIYREEVWGVSMMMERRSEESA